MYWELSKVLIWCSYIDTAHFKTFIFLYGLYGHIAHHFEGVHVLENQSYK
jgi:hypothetical protein